MPPFPLVWHDFDVARRALADERLSDGEPYAELVVRTEGLIGYAR
ncbi:hypothetical protein [Streptomyces inhibens]